MKYRNPIIPGFYPDPSVCRVGEDYYLVTSSFEFFPGVPIFHSKDMVHWEQIGHCLTRKSQLELDGAYESCGIWAPTIRYNNGKFYMTTTNTSGRGNFYVTATDPAGEWSDPIWVDIGGIDPSIFFDDDGRVYFSTNEEIDGKRGIALGEIDIETGKFISPKRHIWGGIGGLAPEGAHIYKINGWYYLMIAEGGTHYGHMETIARSKNIWGPYESCPRNPILTHRDFWHDIQCTGHADLVQAHDGSWWMVFLGVRPFYGMWHHIGRETFLAPVTWDEDGWPVVNGKGSVDIEMEVKQGLPNFEAKAEPLRDDFDGDRLYFYWNFVRNPDFSKYSLTEKKGFLTLTCSKETLDDRASPTLLCRRQQHFNAEVSAALSFDPREGEEAGLTAYRTYKAHYDIALTMLDGVKTVIVRRRMSDLSVIVAKEPVKSNNITLVIKPGQMEYQFGYAEDGGSVKYIASAATQFLAAEATYGPFTGVYIGMYATSNGKESNNKAYFDWFDYKPLD